MRETRAETKLIHLAAFLLFRVVNERGHCVVGDYEVSQTEDGTLGVWKLPYPEKEEDAEKHVAETLFFNDLDNADYIDAVEWLDDHASAPPGDWSSEILLREY